jgi:hypothetical protein
MFERAATVCLALTEALQSGATWLRELHIEGYEIGGEEIRMFLDTYVKYGT